MYPSKNIILGEFIKEYRGRTDPQSCGISVGNRRRVKGLRREELAELCGVSTTWISWIEQGRSQSMSALTLHSICKALQLNHEERTYVFMLANLYDPYSNKIKSVSRTVQKLDQAKEILNQVNYPGFITNRHFDVLSINYKARDIFRKWRHNGFEKENNLLINTFLNPAIKATIENWEACASKIVAKLRFNMPVLMHDNTFCDLIKRLQKESKEFDRYWHQHHVLQSSIGIVNLANVYRKSKSFTHKAFFIESNENISINVLMER